MCHRKHPLAYHPAMSGAIGITFLCLAACWLMLTIALKPTLIPPFLERNDEAMDALAVNLMFSISWPITSFGALLGIVSGLVTSVVQGCQIEKIADAMTRKGGARFRQFFLPFGYFRSVVVLMGSAIVIGLCIAFRCAVMPPFLFYGTALWFVEMPIAGRAYRLAREQYAAAAGADARPTVFQVFGAGLFIILSVACSGYLLYTTFRLSELLQSG